MLLHVEDADLLLSKAEVLRWEPHIVPSGTAQLVKEPYFRVVTNVAAAGRVHRIDNHRN